MTTFFYLLLPVRIVVSLIISLTAAIGYFSDQLGVVIDNEMIRNILENNYSEALDLMTFWFVFRFLLLGVLPVALIWCLPTQKIEQIIGHKFLLY